MKGPFRLLVLYGLVTLGTCQVEVDQFVNVNRGQEVTLRCVYTGSHIPGSITWWKVIGDSSVRIAVALPSGYRINNNTDFYGRLNFTNLTSELRNGSIRIEDLRLGDEGDFTCSFATFDDEAQATISLTVNAPPNVSLELNPSQLIDGMGLVTVATCIAQEGKPAASITWSGLHQGSSSETTEVVSDGTVTVKSRYQMEPKYESHGRTLTCRVEHPAFEFPVNLSTTLDIHYKPSVSIAGYDGDWYVDKEAASLTCEADANPNIMHYLWGRQDGSLPNGAVVSGNSLSFERTLVESDSGSFSCWANNSVGWGEAVVIITIRSGTTTAATTTATTTTTSTTPMAATTPGGGDNGGDDGGVEPWVIAVAVIVPLLVLAAVAGSVFLFCKKKGTQAT
ncbi:nectin-3-like isoform X5 [Petromyzon marinus]|uniref:nectin-3-like isoform X5 n=1 Tax=Petromyzon marinus TaxID=7757 RepID=UPI003F70EE90